MFTRRWQLPLIITLALTALPALLLGIAAMLIYPALPSLESLTDYHPIVPLRVYSADGALLGEFGQERRALVKIADVPDSMKHAILSAEDDSFYQHGGVDYMGVLRAALSNLTGGAKQGASTITMQVARNFFLTKEKTFTRKFNEVLLAFKIEHYLSKDDILQLYINQIYLGQRSYGFASAAQIYFGKPLDKLSIAEAAMLAGLPKAPSSYNPVVNPKRAKLRQLYVLRRMQQLHYITPEEYESAIRQPIVTKHSSQEFAAKADYLTEMVRQAVYEKYQDAIYTNGYKVYTTIRLQDQIAAYRAVRKGVLDYDRRHGYRGPEGFVDISHNASDEVMDDALQEATDGDDLLPAVVLSVSPTQLTAYLRGGERITISGVPLHFAQRSLGSKAPLNQRIVTGSIIRAQKIDDKGTWQISQLPQVEAAFVSGNPTNGAIYSLIGGFDFGHNQFNHITQAWRQPGSSFKPFIYSASLEKGYTPATIINDAPLSFDSSQTGSDPWEPKNYDGKYDGPMRMRQALIQSKNLVSIRIMQSITPQYAQDYIGKFGFPADKHPPYLTTALGAGSVTPLQMLAGYSIFANGGFRVTPYFIARIEDAQGNVLSQAAPAVANENAGQVIDVRNAYTMVSMMQDVIKHGTGIRAMQLGRQDLAGKTGTTSDSIDAWFCGFQPTVVGIAWMGFDQPHSLGDKETGGGAALPIWMDYMGKVLKDVPEAEYTMPENMAAVRINDNGMRDENGSRVEIFYQENVPPEHAMPAPGEATQPADTVKDQLL